MSVRSRGKIDRMLENIVSLPNVVWAGVSTGRCDIIAEVVLVGGKTEPRRFSFTVAPAVLK